MTKAAPSSSSTHRPLNAEWDGLNLYDFVFPLFIFITGTGIAFALPRTLAAQSRREVFKRILWRTLLMYALGVIYYGGLGQAWGEIRYVGVLQRIAICYFVTSLLFMHLRPAAQAYVPICLADSGSAIAIRKAC